MSDDPDGVEDVQEDVDDVEEDQPEIDDDEMADFSAVAEDIEEQAGAGADDDEGEDDSDQADAGDEKDQDTSSETTSSTTDRVTPGDVYCNALGMGAAVARASYGSADHADRSDLVDEYGDMARDMDIDTYVDQWLEEQGGIDELSPGQAILLSTVMFGAMVAMDDPEMIETVAQGVGA